MAEHHEGPVSSGGDRPLTILYVVEASFAGVGRHVLDLAHGCIAAGDVVDIAYGTRRAEPAFLRRLATLGVRHAIPIDVGRAPGTSDLRAVRAVRDVVRRHGPYDVVHGHASKGGLHARLATTGTTATGTTATGTTATGRTARVYTPNAFVTASPELGGLSRWVYGGVERLLARRTDALVLVSPEESEHADAVGVRPRLSRVIPNGIPLDPLPSRSQARADLGLPDDGTVVLGVVGRLSAQKGIDRLLDALSLMGRRTDVVLAVVGEGEDADALRTQADDLGLHEVVRWLGRVPGQTAMPAFDVLVVPSRYEGFPYVVLEGLWAGLPIVATSSSNGRTVLGDGRTGVVIDGTPEGLSIRLATALTELVDDPARRAERAAAARDVVQAYSVEAMVTATRQLYLDLVGARLDVRT
jgi:glycosyltransferase involved in cell wall biosynthesis